MWSRYLSVNVSCTHIDKVKAFQSIVNDVWLDILTAFYCSAADQNNKRIVLALQSGLKSELTWALNTLTLLSFKEKDEVRKDATPLAKIPGLLDALLQVVSLVLLRM